MTKYEIISPGIGFELVGPGVPFSGIVWGRRDGIGRTVVQPGDVLNSSVEDVYKYQAIKVSPSSYVNTPTQYFINLSNRIVFLTMRQKFKIGPVLTPGNILRVHQGTNTVQYIIQPADTVAAALMGIYTAVNAFGGWSPATTSVTQDGVNTLTIETAALTASFTCDLLHPSTALFQIGYYIKAQVGLGSPAQWLIYSAAQMGSYPGIPSLAASYDISDLTALPFGISNYLYVPSYTALAFFDTLQGTSTINNIPAGTTTLTGNDLGYDPVTNRIIAPTSVPFAPEERVNLFMA